MSTPERFGQEAPGGVLLPKQDELAPRRIVVNRIDPANACRAALAQYLREAIFVRWGAKAFDESFKLNEVLEEWPDPDHAQTYPNASIVDSTATAMSGHAFTATPLEETIDVFAKGTVLWKLAEADPVFQVDFWCSDIGQREAIAAHLPALFSPGEDTSRVVLTGMPEHFALPVRATLLDYQRMDTPQGVYETERRLLARIQCDIDVVELRCANVLTPRVLVKVDPVPES